MLEHIELEGEEEQEEFYDLDLFEPHAVQLLILDTIRFTDFTFYVVPTARRVGKTSCIAEVEDPLIDEALLGNEVGIFTGISKDADHHWENSTTIFDKFVKKIKGVSRRITYNGGGRIDFWSIPNKRKQNSGRGEKYKIVIYEEFGTIDDDIARYHFKFVIMALLLDHPDAKVVFFGNPNGMNTYFHELACKGAENGVKHGTCELGEDLKVMPNNKNWITMRFKTSDNPYISKERLAEMAEEFDSTSAKQELGGIFIDYAGKIWCSALSDENVMKKVFKSGLKINWSDPIYLSFDFNKQPMTCTLFQFPMIYQSASGINNNRVFLRGVKVLKSFQTDIETKSSIHDMIQLIKEFILQETGVKVGKWYEGKKGMDGFAGDIIEDVLVENNPCHFNIHFTGDASGDDDGDGRQKAPRDYYDILADEFNASQATQFLIPSKNPYHAESYIQVNFYLEKHPLLEIDQDECRLLKDDMLSVNSDKNRGIIKTDSKLTHHLDNFRYGLNTWQRLISRF